MSQVRERLKDSARVLLLLLGATYVVWFAVGTRFAAPTPGPKTLLEDRVEILDVEPARVHPGSVCILRVAGIEPGGVPLRAMLGKLEARVLRQSADAVAIQVPRDADAGRLKVRLSQGQRTSKSRDLWVNPVHLFDLLRNLLLGLGFFSLGLTTLSKSLRGLTGKQQQQRVAAMTGGKARGILAGVVLGCLSQSMLATASVSLSAVRSRFVSNRGMFRLFIGAQLGAVLIWLLLPGSSEGDIVVVAACGALWSLLSSNRRSKYRGKVVLGMGFLLFGVYQLRASADLVFNFQEVLAPIDGTRFIESVRNTLVGVLFGGLMQGQGPVFAFVHQLHTEYGLLSLKESLQLLFGAGSGASLLSVVACWGHQKARRTAIRYALASSTAALTLSALSPFLVQSAWISGFVNSSTSLFAVFLLPQTLALLVLAWLIRGGNGAATFASTEPAPNDSESSQLLAQALKETREAFVRAVSMRVNGDRGISVETEKLLARADTEVRRALTRAEAPDQGTVVQFSVLLSNLQSHVRLIESGLEQGVTFPAELAQAVSHIEEMVGHCLEQAESLLRDGSVPDLEQWRAREIRINLAEQEARRSLTVDPAQPGVAMHLTQVLASLESLGNLCYRLQEAMNPEAEFV